MIKCTRLRLNTQVTLRRVTTITITSISIKAKEKKKMTRKKTSISNTHTKKINEGKEATPYLLKKIHDGP